MSRNNPFRLYDTDEHKKAKAVAQKEFKALINKFVGELNALWWIHRDVGAFDRDSREAVAEYIVKEIESR